MTVTAVDIMKDALAKVGLYDDAPVSDLAEKPMYNHIYATQRDLVLSLYPWNFALKRKRITAAGLLDCSAKTITYVVNSGADTITDSGSEFVTGGFEDGDIASPSGGDSNGSYQIATVAAGTLTLETHEDVTAEILTNDTDLKLYALDADGYYKFAKPSDCLKVRAVNGVKPNQKTVPVWYVKGGYIITTDIDENDQISVEYIQQVTDPTNFSIQFREAITIKLASVLAKAQRDNMWEKKFWEGAFDAYMMEFFRQNAQEGNRDKSREDTAWQKAGR